MLQQTKIHIFLLSEDIELLKAVSERPFVRALRKRRNPVSRVQDGYRLHLLSFSKRGYDSDPIFFRLTNFLRSARLRSLLDDIENVKLLVEIHGHRKCNELDSFEGYLFRPDLVSLAAELKIQFNVVLDINFRQGWEEVVDSGAYLEIYNKGDDDRELDIPAINRAAGVEANLVYKKGMKNKNGHVINFNLWEYGQTFYDQRPDIPIRAIMDSVKSPEEFGRFCQDHDLKTRVDLTCYGVPDKIISFPIDYRFFVFCRHLKAKWICLDISV